MGPAWSSRMVRNLVTVNRQGGTLEQESEALFESQCLSLHCDTTLGESFLLSCPQRLKRIVPESLYQGVVLGLNIYNIPGILPSALLAFLPFSQALLLQ